MGLTEEQKNELRRQSQTLAGVFNAAIRNSVIAPESVRRRIPEVTPAPALAPIKLTPFQFLEVEGLLDVVDDELSMGNTDFILWGRIDRKAQALTVFDAPEAADTLRHRAQWFLDEIPKSGGNGGPGARSLLALVDRIERDALLARMEGSA